MAQCFTYQDQKISVGDTIRVHQQITEGGKKRIQVFEGIVIAIKNRQNNKSFTVRKIAANNIGVEKIFPVSLPSIKKIEVKRKGQVRRSKLYYLRDRIGKQATALKNKALSPKQRRKHNFSLGKIGEQRAGQFLERHNYQILDTNICIANREIDLVALDKKVNELVFVEVKTRKNERWGNPSKAVNRRKLKSMAVVANFYCQLKKTKLDYRFDIITLISGKIRHYRNVTWSAL